MITLGPNYEQMHACFACIVREGQLLFVAAETHTRPLKRDAHSFPFRNVRIARAGDGSPR